MTDLTKKDSVFYVCSCIGVSNHVRDSSLLEYNSTEVLGHLHDRATGY
jgi:hypothetical protein